MLALSSPREKTNNRKPINENHKKNHLYGHLNIKLQLKISNSATEAKIKHPDSKNQTAPRLLRNCSETALGESTTERGVWGG